MKWTQKLHDLVTFVKSKFGDDVDDFEMHCAIYWYASAFYDGQGSELYAVLCCSPYGPGRNESGPGEDIASSIYDALVTEYENRSSSGGSQIIRF